MKHTKIKSMNDEKKYDEALRLLIEYTCTVKKKGGWASVTRSHLDLQYVKNIEARYSPATQREKQRK